jgi:hypothetical protein
VAISSAGEARICVSRRTVLQDLLRRYTVFIDGEPTGKLWAFQTGRYPVSPGHHRLRLGIETRLNAPLGLMGSSSDEIDVEVGADEARSIRTKGRGPSGYLSRRGLLRRPWIILELHGRR